MESQETTGDEKKFYGQYTQDNKFYFDLLQEKSLLISELAREKNHGNPISSDSYLIGKVAKLIDKMYTLAGNYNILKDLKIKYDDGEITFGMYRDEIMRARRLKIRETIIKLTQFSSIFFQRLAVEADMRKTRSTIFPWERRRKARKKREVELEAEQAEDPNDTIEEKVE